MEIRHAKFRCGRDSSGPGICVGQVLKARIKVQSFQDYEFTLAYRRYQDGARWGRTGQDPRGRTKEIDWLG